jgi:hypothetical protein
MPTRIAVLPIVGFLVCAVLSVTASMESVADQRVTVRVYNNFGLPIKQLEAAQEIAAAIFHAAGVDATWRDCRTPHGPSKTLGDRCDTTLTPTEVIVRIVVAPSSADNHRSPFGYSHVDTGTHQGSLSTVFGDRIYASVRHLGIAAAPLLGRVLAHEVIHLLIGTETHSTSGLMRATWSDSLLQRNSEQDWFLSRQEGTQIAQALNARRQGAPIPVINLAASQSQAVQTGR